MSERRQQRRGAGDDPRRLPAGPDRRLDPDGGAAQHPRRPRVLRDTSLSWAQNAYTLTFGGLLLLGARAGDLLGRRRTFMLGIGVFTAASLAVGLAQSPAGMIAARAVQGIGAATLAPSTLALLSTSFPEGPRSARARWPPTARWPGSGRRSA